MPLPLLKHWTQQILTPDAVAREKYEAFRELLERDRRGHELIAELEELYYGGRWRDRAGIAVLYDELATTVAAMIDRLHRMAPADAAPLRDYFAKIDTYGRYLITPPPPRLTPPYVLDLAATVADHRALVGGKGLTLALLKNSLDLPVPDGFTITTSAFNAFLDANRLRPVINRRLTRLAIDSPAALEREATELVDLLLAAPLPPAVAAAIDRALASMVHRLPAGQRFILRSSAEAEDSRLSFAGQYHSEANVAPADFATAYKRVVASKYQPHALYYRIRNGLSDEETPMAVVVLPMLAAKVSGVMFTTDPTDCETLAIHAVAGSGAPLVSGEAVARVTLVAKGQPDRLARRTGAPAPLLTDAEALTLAHWGTLLEGFYREAQEVEWCRDESCALRILQSRPLSGPPPAPPPVPAPVPPELPLLLAGGERAAGGVGSGSAFVLSGPARLNDLPPGSVLVTATTPPDLVRVMDRLRAVVADRGSVAGHFATVAREFGVPTLVNTGEATRRLANGQEITVDADAAAVYGGLTPARAASPGLPDTPYRSRLRFLLDFVAPLRLVDPSAADFSPAGCRSHHDIIRFIHEKGMAAMFAIGSRWSAKTKGGRRLRTTLPMAIYLLDVGGGLAPEAAARPEVDPEELRCTPLRAVLAGLTHPDIDWSGHRHFDWRSFDSVVMAGGVASRDAAAFASYAVVGENYLNLSLRFGYHFTVFDVLCSERHQENYALLRFAGGGGDFAGRARRLAFLARVLDELGFTVTTKGDLLDARLAHADRAALTATSQAVGRLLGVTRLMDMRIKDDAQVAEWATAFLRGTCRFGGDARAGEG